MAAWLGAPTDADLGLEGVWITIKAGADGAQPKLFVFQIIGTAYTVASVAEFAIGKTVAVPVVPNAAPPSMWRKPFFKRLFRHLFKNKSFQNQRIGVGQ